MLRINGEFELYPRKENYLHEVIYSNTEEVKLQGNINLLKSGVLERLKSQFIR